VIKKCTTQLERLAHSPYLPALLALLAFCLTLPALQGGLAGDDYIQLYTYSNVASRPNDGSLFGMFSFLNGDPALNQRAIESGQLPWWTDPNLRITFWRPVTEATHWIDYQLWLDSPALMHLHSLLWYALLVFLAARTYARLMPDARTSALAGLLFAVNYSHAVCIGWIAGRNALVTAVFGVVCLLAHARWRSSGNLKSAAVAAAALSLSLLSAEAGIAVCAYLFSYMVFLDEAPLKRRLLSLLPYVGIVLVWKLFHSGLGYGASHSGFYLDPTSEPLAFLHAALHRWPLLLFALITDLPIGFFLLASQATRSSMVLIAMISTTLLAIVLLPLVIKQRLARFYILAIVLAIIPACAVVPDNRLLLIASFGGCGLMSMIFANWFSRSDSGRPWILRIPQTGFVIVLLFMKSLLSVVAFPGSINGQAEYLEYISTNPALNLPVEGRLSEKQLFFINTPLSAMMSNMIPAVRRYHMLDLPASIYTLGPGDTELSIWRVDANELIIEAKDGFAIGMDEIFRSSSAHFHAGDKIRLAAMTVEVLSVTDEFRPKTVAFRFSSAIDDPSKAFLHWDNGRYRQLELPKPGNVIHLAAIDSMQFVRERWE